MLRLNLLLLLIAVFCALGTVSANHKARKLLAEYERAQNHMHDLDVEWGQLQLEQSTWANHARIEQVARDKLMMRAPGAGQMMVLEAAR
ncbi:MAG: cell division protein FtsL [Zoogloeaceae bacterium]|jgi:cell division protein FtsL|nr:cell division protein FtsL [Zoogloeaceae bacterium]